MLQSSRDLRKDLRPVSTTSNRGINPCLLIDFLRLRLRELKNHNPVNTRGENGTLDRTSRKFSFKTPSGYKKAQFNFNSINISFFLRHNPVIR